MRKLTGGDFFSCRLCTLGGISFKDFKAATNFTGSQGRRLHATNRFRHAKLHYVDFFENFINSSKDSASPLNLLFEESYNHYVQKVKKQVEGLHAAATRVRTIESFWRQPSAPSSISSVQRKRYYGRASFSGLRSLSKRIGARRAYVKWMVVADRILNNNSISSASGDSTLAFAMAASVASIGPHSEGVHVNASDAMELAPSAYEVNNIIIPALKYYVLLKMADTFRSMDYFCITTDGWTSGGQADSPHYSSFVVHFIDALWNLRVVPLGAFGFKSSSCDAATIAKFVREVLESQLLPKAATLSCITTDTASTQFLANEMVLGDNADDMVGCFQHTLRLVMLDAVKSVPSVFGHHQLCVALTGAFSRNPTLAGVLKKLQVERTIGEPDQQGDAGDLVENAVPRWRRLRASICTRFDTYIVSMAAVLENLPLLVEMDKLGYLRDHESFDVKQISEPLLDGIVGVLRPLGEFLDRIGTEHSVSISVVPDIIEILHAGAAPCAAEHQIFEGTPKFDVEKFKLSVRKGLLERFIVPYLTRPGPVLYGALFDPRVGRDHLHEIVTALVPSSTPGFVNAEDVIRRSVCVLRDHLVAMDKSLHENEGSDGGMSAARAENKVSEVLVEALEAKLPMSGDPLRWWKMKSNDFAPVVLMLVRSYLCCPASSTSSERLFSSAGLICTPRRSSLAVETLEDLLILYKNARIIAGLTYTDFLELLNQKEDDSMDGVVEEVEE
jgi:hypothetical protein